MSKLWQKDYSLDSLMEEFTVSNDYILDQQLVIADCLGSIAHARGLHHIGILDAEELASLEEGLKKIISLKMEDSFPITKENEDCHTAIEGFLTDEYGEVGKKIHTGRSRNDQVQTALRIWMREFTLKLCRATGELCETLLSFAEKYAEVPMPGRTHMQIAMPSSLGLWAASYAEELYDEAQHMMHLSWLGTGRLGGGMNVAMGAYFSGYQITINGKQHDVMGNQMSLTVPYEKGSVSVAQVNSIMGVGESISVRVD